MSDNTIFITGGTSGIGKETTLALAQAGATVVFTARTKEIGETIQQQISTQSGNQHVSFLVCDLSSLDAVRRMGTEFIERHQRLDVLINNAGVMEHTRKVSVDGFEMDFAVNYLAPFLLTNLLLPTLKASAPARIINVSSYLHQHGVINFDDLQSEHTFDRHATYAQSKLALMLFTAKLARDLAGTGVTANTLHPGVVATNINAPSVAQMNSLKRFAYMLYSATRLSPKQGAQTSIYLALSPEVAHVTGAYFDNKKIVEASPLVSDEKLADRLWEVSARLVGL